MKLPVPLSFEWDRGNLKKNWKKHKVHSREAEEVFFNEPVKIFPDLKHSTSEKRFQALGVTDKKRYLAVIFTIRHDKIRIVSVRNQSRKERARYAKKAN